MTRLVAGLMVAALAAVVGCSGVASPFEKAEPGSAVGSQAVRNYQEIERDGQTFVVATPANVKKVREGGEPTPKMAAIGFPPDGRKVIFEDSKEGLGRALSKEYLKRHPRK